MTAPVEYREIKLEVRPSPQTNSHEVRFLADGTDLIARYWSEMIGLDPEHLLLEPCLLRAGAHPHMATVARCSCGEIGCGSIQVEISRLADWVVWKPQYGSGVLRFDVVAYDAAVEHAISDTTWETPDRPAARLLRGQVNRDALSRYGFVYDWASGRGRPATFTISLRMESGAGQICVRIPWTTETPEEIVARCVAILAEAPETWADVTWNGRTLPSIAGPGWRVHAR
jgi:hypothetical protein